MKAIHGLVIAVGLGIAAAFFNFAYLNFKSTKAEKEYFIGVKPNVTINRGDRLSEENLAPIGIPKGSVGNLDKFAIRYDDLETVKGMNVWRTLNDSALLLRDDLRTPPQELDLKEGERAMWIPIDSRAFVPSLVEPGDLVDFIVSTSLIAQPTPAVPESDPQGASPVPVPGPTPMGSTRGKTEIIGPFKVLALGNRLGSSDVMKAARIPQTQENVMAISAKEVNGKLEEQAQKLWNILQSTNFRGVGILLRDRKTPKP
jgi:Flp pilus assembly protein CpaB